MQIAFYCIHLKSHSAQFYFFFKFHILELPFKISSILYVLYSLRHGLNKIKILKKKRKEEKSFQSIFLFFSLKNWFFMFFFIAFSLPLFRVSVVVEYCSSSPGYSEIKSVTFSNNKVEVGRKKRYKRGRESKDNVK